MLYYIDIMLRIIYIIFIHDISGGMGMKNRLRELRARHHWTQEDLAKRVGVTRQTVGMMEKGDYSPSVLLALKVAYVFRVCVEEVFEMEHEDYPEGGRGIET
jgi:putative transcriptional regulator